MSKFAMYIHERKLSKEIYKPLQVALSKFKNIYLDFLNNHNLNVLVIQ